jgi:replicative DNA helicase
MSTITNLNKTTPEELRILLEAVQVKIKKKANDRYELYCPSCTKPEAYIYFKGGTRTIKCNREENCGFKEELWQCISNKQGIDSNNKSEMLRYINQTLGRNFENFTQEQNADWHASKTFISQEPEIAMTPPAKTIEELEQEANDTSKKQKFFKACHQIFTNNLNNQDDSQVTFSLKYLREVRGYNDKQIEFFKLGFFPNKSNLESLLQEKYSYSALETEELITKYFDGIQKNNNYQKTEYGKARITLTWYDTDGKIVGFTVRKPTSDSTIKAKYLNNNGLSKTDYLFNLPNLEEEKTSKNIVIVEGLLDALSGTYYASQQEETKNYHFAATGGSQITDNQIACLKSKGYSKVILLPDKDEAGTKGLKNSSAKLIEQGISHYVASIPDDYKVKDIDEFIKKHSECVDLELILTTKATLAIESQLNNKDLKSTMSVDKLIQIIHSDQKESIAKKELLDIHKYQKMVHEVQKTLLENNIAETIEKAKDGTDFQKLQNIMPNIKRYNDLLAINSNEDAPYTYAKFLEDINESSEGLKTGFSVLDQYITIQPSSLVIVAGRPSHGKTTMMLNMLRNMIENYPDKSFVFYSYEERRQDILLKLMLSMTQKTSDIEKKDGVSPLTQLMEQLKTGTLSECFIDINTMIEKWIQEGRLQLMNPKNNVEILSTSIIDRVVSSNEIKPVGAIFIDYVQKLSTTEQTINRQQEVQKICQTLLHTALNKKVKASIILGAQVNREVKSLDTFNAENMREAGDIEQDANIILGVWDETAGYLSRLQELSIGLERQILDLDIDANEKNKKIIEDKLKRLKDKIEKAQDKADSNQQKSIKILKNRNGANNKFCDLMSYPNRFLFKDTNPKT